MFYRILFFTLMVLFSSAFLVQGNVNAQQTDKDCYKYMCGPGYKPAMQQDGKCICIPADNNGPGSGQSPSTVPGDGTKPVNPPPS